MLHFLHIEDVAAVKWQNVHNSLMFTVPVNFMFRGKLTDTGNCKRW